MKNRAIRKRKPMLTVCGVKSLDVETITTVDQLVKKGFSLAAAAQLMSRPWPVVFEMQSTRLGQSTRKALEKLTPKTEMERGHRLSLTMSGGQPLELRVEQITQHRSGVVSVTAVKTFPRRSVPKKHQPYSWGRLGPASEDKRS